MALIKRPLTATEVKKKKSPEIKTAYNELSRSYQDILKSKYIICPKCGNVQLASDDFYTSPEFFIGYFPICKNCVKMIVEQREHENDPPNETKKSVQNMLQLMNLPYIDSLYENAKKNYIGRPVFPNYIKTIKSLPQYSQKTWANSTFEAGHKTREEINLEDMKIAEKGRKRFGNGLKNDDYLFLENEYQDWITRHECNTKAQEEIFQRLALKKWEIAKATKAGMSTKDLDKSYQELLATGKLQPRQNSNDTISDAQTLGTLIAKWETERPLPDIDPELEDVDKIGRYIDVFFRGHMAKLLGLKNTLSHLYQRFMDKYTVKRPEYDGDDDSEALFDAIFGDHPEESGFSE